MHNYEYSSLSVDTNAKNGDKRKELDKVINDAAAKGWELVTYTALANSWTGYGRTTEILMTFRREITSGPSETV